MLVKIVLIQQLEEIPRYQQNVADGEGYSFLDTYAGGDSEGGSNSGEYGDEDVEHFAPKRFVFHDFLVDS